MTKRICACYDHLGGALGERLAARLVELGWVTPEPSAGVTPEGWSGFGSLGLDLAPLLGSRRKPVAFCTERHDNAAHEHLGGHLGALLRRHMLALGWLEPDEGGLALTPEGDRMLQNLGIQLEA